MRRFIWLCVLSAACSAPPAPSSGPPPASAEEAAVLPSDGGPGAAAGVAGLAPGAGVADELARLGRAIEVNRLRAQQHPTDWGANYSVASAFLERARLTGDYDDYTEAEAALATAFERAVKGSGPFVLRAKLNATLHRLDRVDADLDFVKDWVTAGLHSRPRAIIQRAALHFQRGEIDEAKRGYSAALGMQRGAVTPLAGLALVHWKTGDFEASEGLYGDILALLRGRKGEPPAWTHLQLGLIDLDRGRYSEALAHYRDADAALPGYWLVHEHIAEITLLLGHREAAAALYDKVIEDTDGSPEFLDARASMYLEDGDEAAAKELIDRARQAYEQRLERFPEATYGHALGHFLEFGPVDRAVELAEKNHALRPNGEAQAQLIEAWLQAGRAAEAATLADDFAKSPWRIARGHAAMSAAYAEVGRDDDAAVQRAAALAVDPHVFD